MVFAGCKLLQLQVWKCEEKQNPGDVPPGFLESQRLLASLFSSLHLSESCFTRSGFSCIVNTKHKVPRQHIKKQRHYFANKGPSSQCYGFSSSHVWMWELDYKESWAPKNWCFWTSCWRRLLRVPWTARRSNQSILKEISPENSLARRMLKLKFQNFGHLMRRADSLEKDPDAGKDWRQEKGTTEDEMVGWHHQLDVQEFEQALGVGDGQGSLVCCSPWGCRVGHDWLNWLKESYIYSILPEHGRFWNPPSTWWWKPPSQPFPCLTQVNILNSASQALPVSSP